MKRHHPLVHAAIALLMAASVFVGGCRDTANAAAEAPAPPHVDAGTTSARDDAQDASRKAGEAQPRTIKLPSHLSHIVFSGGDGSSCQKAVVIEHAKNTTEGIEAENAWLTTVFPQAAIIAKGQSGQGGKRFESVELKSKQGSVERVCFDITGFFGQW